jgi:hypothetical protein
MMNSKENARHLDVVELAKLIRTTLKAHFPGVKFGVTTDRYSMGSTVRVRWTDGPTTHDVDAILSRYDRVTFDGMTDSTGNKGPVQLDNGEWVRIYSYISTSRDNSETMRARVRDFMTRNNIDPQHLHRVAWGCKLVNNCLIVGKDALRSL